MVVSKVGYTVTVHCFTVGFIDLIFMTPKRLVLNMHNS